MKVNWSDSITYEHGDIYVSDATVELHCSPDPADDDDCTFVDVDLSGALIEIRADVPFSQWPTAEQIETLIRAELRNVTDWITWMEAAA